MDKEQRNMGLKKNHQRIADIWTILLDKKLNGAITPEEVVACMIGVKVARLAEDISKMTILGQTLLAMQLWVEKL